MSLNHRSAPKAYFHYATTYYGGGFFYFGGEIGYSGNKSRASNLIARLDSTSLEWSKAGNLNYLRSRNAVILLGERFWIVGGVDRHNATRDIRTELCDINRVGQVLCTSQSSTLSDYFTPLLFAVPNDYNKC